MNQFSETPFTKGNICRAQRLLFWTTATLGINNWISETLGIFV
jgi:hypothetical protein